MGTFYKVVGFLCIAIGMFGWLLNLFLVALIFIGLILFGIGEIIERLDRLKDKREG